MTPSPPSPQAVAASVAAMLGSPAETVTVTGQASVGAVRSTWFLGCTAPNHPQRLVAQIRLEPTTDAEPLSVSAQDEASVIALAAEAGVPVAPLLAASDEAPITGCPTLLSAHVDGETIPRRILRSLGAHPSAESASLSSDFGAAFAKLHAAPTDRLPHHFVAARNLTAPTDYVVSLHTMLDGVHTPLPSVRLALNWLLSRAPEPVAHPRLVHGDFRLGNLIVNGPHLAAVIDWELSHLGDPMEDLAWMCVRMWRFGNDELVGAGIATLAELEQAYTTAGGTWNSERFHWWLTARTAWWTIGLARQAQAFGDGGSTSLVHAASGRRVPELEHDLLSLLD